MTVLCLIHKSRSMSMSQGPPVSMTRYAPNVCMHASASLCCKSMSRCLRRHQPVWPGMFLTMCRCENACMCEFVLQVLTYFMSPTPRVKMTRFVFLCVYVCSYVRVCLCRMYACSYVRVCLWSVVFLCVSACVYVLVCVRL